MQLSISTEDIKVSDKKLLYVQDLPGRVNFPHSSWYGLCFAFVLKTVWTIQGRFHYCLAHTQSRPFLFFTLSQKKVGWGSARTWEGTQLGQLTSTD